MDQALDPDISMEAARIPFGFSRKPREQWRISGGPQSGALPLLMETYTGCVAIPKLVREIVAFGREFRTEVLWCILQGQTMIRLAMPVARKLGVVLRSEVWDPPVWWLRAKRVDRLSRMSVLRKFASTLENSASCATASWAMAEEYSRLYQTITVPLLPSLDVTAALVPADEIHSGGDFVIGMAGQLYANDEWQSLIAALDSVNWKILDRNVRIALLGRSASLRAKNRSNIEFLGWRSQADTIQILSEADVLYCPYWFDPLFESEARLSFPSKLTTYFAAGRPVCFHGPRYASPAKFITQYNAGVCCHSLVATDIVQMLTRLVSDKQLYAQVAQNGRKAFEEKLTLSCLRASFSEFLKVDKRLFTAP